MKDISIIIPAYNAENYLVKCLNSLVNQTKKEIEIIIVNDGSTDRTKDIADRFKNKYPDLVKVISQSNQGQSVARNVGIENAEGKYIGFVDCDDYVSKDMFQKLYEKATENDYDIVACNVDCIYPNKEVKIKSGIEEDIKNISIEEKKKLFLNMYAVIWNKIYKKEIFENKDLLFEPGIWFEDVLFLHKLIPNIKSCACVEDYLYKYIQRKTSVTYTYSERLSNIHIVMEKILKYYEDNDLYQEYKDELEYMYVRYMLATYVKRLAKTKDKKKFDEGVSFVIKNVKEKFPNYKKNKHIKEKGFKNIYLKMFNKNLANIIYHLEKNKMN